MSKNYIRADSTPEQKLIIKKLMRGDVLGPYSEECAAIRFHIAELEAEAAIRNKEIGRLFVETKRLEQRRSKAVAQITDLVYEVDALKAQPPEA